MGGKKMQWEVKSLSSEVKASQLIASWEFSSFRGSGFSNEAIKTRQFFV